MWGNFPGGGRVPQEIHGGMSGESMCGRNVSYTVVNWQVLTVRCPGVNCAG